MLKQFNSNDKKPDKSIQINQIVNHPCQELAFSAHEDKFIKYFDLRSYECTHSMIAHLESVSSLAIDMRGDHLLSGGHDSSLRVWDIRKKTCTQELMVCKILVFFPYKIKLFIVCLFFKGKS